MSESTTEMTECVHKNENCLTTTGHILMASCKHLLNELERMFEVKKSASGRLMISKNGKTNKQTNKQTYNY